MIGYGNVAVYPANGGPPVRYSGARYAVHEDGDLSVHTTAVSTASVWARGMWQHVEAAPE
ncbi:hypothetical protein OG474_09775 [Kribbella sp. NBC_01505]|uniref:hypothetical protein n=1 Tax=Kribbella sp. NBC_01505 TaxID=2903580 RepID=UPI0038631E67